MMNVSRCPYKTVIRKCSKDLKELLNLNCLMDSLWSKGLLTDQEQQELTSEIGVPSRQNTFFIHKVLPYKGDQAFQRFLRILEKDRQHSGHKELFHKLSNCYADKESVQPSDSEPESCTATKQSSEFEQIIRETIKNEVRDELTSTLTSFMEIMLSNVDKKLKESQEKMEAMLSDRLQKQEQENLDRYRRLENMIKTSQTKSRSISVSSTVTSNRSSIISSNYHGDCEESDNVSSISGEDSKRSSIYSNCPEELGSSYNEQLSSDDIVTRPRTRSLTSNTTTGRRASTLRLHNSFNIQNKHKEHLKLPIAQRPSSSRESSPSRKRGPSPLTQEAMTNTSPKISCEETSVTIAEILSKESRDSSDTNTTIYGHKGTDTTHDNSIALHVDASTSTDSNNSSDSSSYGNTSSLPVDASTSFPNCVKQEDVPCASSSRLHVPTICDFTIGDPSKQQVYCQEKDGVVYFISWTSKPVKCNRISKLDAHHDTVATYSPTTAEFSPEQCICRRANMTYAYGILNFKNKIVLVAGDNLKFLDGSVYLYSLVQCKKYQKAFSYKWSEMAKSGRSLSPIVASPMNSVCLADQNCILICQLTAGNSRRKAISVSVYNEACDSKWKAVSLHLPVASCQDSSHLSSGTVHQGTLCLSMKTVQGFVMIQTSISSLEDSDDSVTHATRTISFFNIMDSSIMRQYLLFDCFGKLFATSMSENSGTCSIGSVAGAADYSVMTNLITKQSISDCDTLQLHSVIPVPTSNLVIFVYYNPQLQCYIMNRVHISTFQTPINV